MCIRKANEFEAARDRRAVAAHSGGNHTAVTRLNCLFRIAGEIAAYKEARQKNAGKLLPEEEYIVSGRMWHVWRFQLHAS
jgi:hypothetical protein